MTRLLSILFTSIPAALWLTRVLLTDGDDYFWLAYIIACGFFLTVSLVIGFLGPTLFPQSFKRHPGLFIFGQGLMAWMSAFFVLGILNLTPMCVGQDNGDGNNDLVMCVIQTVLVGLAYSPLELFLLVPSAVIGGFLLRKRST